MDQKSWKTIKAIHNFVSTLKETFPKDLPLCLYERLLSRIEPKDQGAGEKLIDSFSEFFEAHSKAVLEHSPFPPETRVVYNDRIYIALSKHISKLEPYEVDLVYSHLLTIYAFIDPKGAALRKLEKRVEQIPVDRTTEEGKFIDGIFSTTKRALEQNPNLGQNSDPMAAASGMLQIFPSILAGITGGISEGNLDPQKLLGEMCKTLGALAESASKISPEEKEEKSHISEIKEEEEEKKEEE